LSAIAVRTEQLLIILQLEDGLAIIWLPGRHSVRHQLKSLFKKWQFHGQASLRYFIDDFETLIRNQMEYEKDPI
jgi:hypothetical protein